MHQQMRKQTQSIQSCVTVALISLSGPGFLKMSELVVLLFRVALYFKVALSQCNLHTFKY